MDFFPLSRIHSLSLSPHLFVSVHFRQSTLFKCKTFEKKKKKELKDER